MHSSQSLDSSLAPLGDGFLSQFVSRDRIRTGVQVSSKKRLLEEVAELLTRFSEALDKDTVFQILNERERLGSTGIGEGFAIPHGRINGIDQPIICAILLSQPLDFDSIDNKPVRCIVGLLVPADANQTHLQILAKLARTFSQDKNQKKIMACEDADRFYRMLNEIS